MTHDPLDKGKFRTPPLRNVALTAPYMHDGTFRTLRQVVDFYDRGGGRSRYPTKDPILMPLHLQASEKKDLVAFLQALTGETKKEMNQP
ncbi:MAG: Cytochrome-c peroxidase [Leptospirillum sp. Group IV 'UBA BS']|nr:MAG: Cytochrome-c peroxidase [Leptospirillum sp. Group IV 'UBA BS']